MFKLRYMVPTSKPATAFQSIRPAKINFYLRCMREMGFKPGQVLKGTGINEQALQDRFTLIQIPDYIRIVSNMMELSQDPTLAFKLGSYLEAGDLGVLGCAFSSADSVKEGMKVWRRYNRLFFGELISVRQFRESNIEFFEFVPQVPLLPHLLQFFIEEKISVEAALYNKLNDCSLGQVYFGVTYSRPAHGDFYDKFFQVDVEFNADSILFGIDSEDRSYNKRLNSANTELFEFCLEHLDKISNIASNQETLSPRVRHFLMKGLPNITSLAELATTFNMSKRTLCRNLELEKTSYKKLLSEVRAELAKNYLLTTAMNADRIALKLGFENAGSLHRSFKQWTGSTMKQYRARHSAGT